MNIYTIVQSLLHVFDQRQINVFRAFLNRYPKIKKWSIASDYSTTDKKNVFDCFSFVVYPYKEFPPAAFDYIASKLATDIKKKRNVSEDVITFFQESNRFYICIILDKKRNTSLKVARRNIKAVFNHAISNGSSQDAVCKIRELLNKSKNKAFNLKLYSDIILLAAFYNFISILLLRECQVEIIGWFSDRDNMTNYCNGVVWVFAMAGLSLAKEIGLRLDDTKIFIGSNNESSREQGMWYDALIRPADYLCNVLANWRVSQDGCLSVNHPKQRKMLQHIVTDNENIVILYPKFQDANSFPIVNQIIFSSSPP